MERVTTRVTGGAGLVSGPRGASAWPWDAFENFATARLRVTCTVAPSVAGAQKLYYLVCSLYALDCFWFVRIVQTIVGRSKRAKQQKAT